MDLISLINSLQQENRAYADSPFSNAYTGYKSGINSNKIDQLMRMYDLAQQQDMEAKKEEIAYRKALTEGMKSDQEMKQYEFSRKKKQEPIEDLRLQTELSSEQFKSKNLESILQNELDLKTTNTKRAQTELKQSEIQLRDSETKANTRKLYTELTPTLDGISKGTITPAELRGQLRALSDQGVVPPKIGQSLGAMSNDQVIKLARGFVELSTTRDPEFVQKKILQDEEIQGRIKLAAASNDPLSHLIVRAYNKYLSNPSDPKAEAQFKLAIQAKYPSAGNVEAKADLAREKQQNNNLLQIYKAAQKWLQENDTPAMNIMKKKDSSFQTQKEQYKNIIKEYEAGVLSGKYKQQDDSSEKSMNNQPKRIVITKEDLE